MCAGGVQVFDCRREFATKGGIVLAVIGHRDAETSTVKIDFSQMLREVTAVSPGKQAVDVVASATSRGRNEIYRLMLSQRGDAGDVVCRRSVKAWEPRQNTSLSH
jgi:hypothetical protein